MLQADTVDTGNTIDVATLADEWERIELLVQGLKMSRQGQSLDGHVLDRLSALSARVHAGRECNGSWRNLPIDSLSPLEHDVLACILAVEMHPRIGWQFLELQPGVSQPYPTPALLHELLALEGEEVALFQMALSSEGLLRREGWIRVESDDPFQPIKPAPGLMHRLLGLDLPPPPPPGAITVRLKSTWDDLVLPHNQVTQLREFLLWIRHLKMVEEQWGGRAGGGPVALFSGPSGTGKTLAASVLAGELGWPLYRVDLGKLVSKYIGETEKNLNQLFDAAHGRQMILQFDEADSLFGKRGEIKDARDRYANMEVSHLLARMEEHRGPCILTTNMHEHMDSAFARRFHVVVGFPRPDKESRVHLWQRLLPPRAPMRDEVDPQFLGQAVNLTGGGIRNAALYAACLAAEEQGPMELRHVALGVWRELAKDASPRSRSELGPLAPYLAETNGMPATRNGDNGHQVD